MVIKKHLQKLILDVKNVEKIKEGDLVRKVSGADLNQMGMKLRKEI